MRDLLLAFIMAVIGLSLLASNDVNDASGGQFIVGWIAWAIAVGFIANWLLERTEP
jgi:FtsH-binding integral membrane protein